MSSLHLSLLSYFIMFTLTRAKPPLHKMVEGLVAENRFENSSAKFSTHLQSFAHPISQLSLSQVFIRPSIPCALPKNEIGVLGLVS